MNVAVNAIELKINTAPVYLPLLDKSRWKAAFGGRGSGKSHFFAELVVERCCQQKTRVVCIREIQKDLKSSSRQLIVDKIEAMGVSAFFDVYDDRIEAKNGSFIIFQGMQSHTKESIKSLESFDIAWVEEAQALSKGSLTILTPTIRKKDSELWFSWNPRHRTDPVDALFRGDEPPPDSIIVEANFRDNPWFDTDTELREDMLHCRRTDIDDYRHIWLGQYMQKTSASVFKNWRIAEIDVPPGSKPYYGADWGFKDPSVLVRCYLVGADVLYFDAEAVDEECPLDQTPALFAGDDRQEPPRWTNERGYKGIAGALEWPITADSGRPDTIEYMQSHGFTIIPARKGARSIEDGIEFMKSLDIVINPRCDRIIDEFTLYAWKVDKHTEQILPVLEDKHNHTIDAARYALESERRRRGLFKSTSNHLAEEARQIPSVWQRVGTIVVEPQRFVAVWAAYERSTDVIHIYEVYDSKREPAPIHAEALKARGKWIPLLLAEPEKRSMRQEVERVGAQLGDLGVDLMEMDFDIGESVEAMAARLTTGRIKVVSHLTDWFNEYRAFGRDDQGEIVVDRQPIMQATALLVAHGLDSAVSENMAVSNERGMEDADMGAPTSSTGY